MTIKTKLIQEFEDIARYQGAIDFECKDDFTNEILPSPATYFNYTTEIAWRVFVNTRKKNATIAQLRSEIESLKKVLVQRVVTQLSTVFVKEGSYSNCDYIHYVALCNDGTMWFKEDGSHEWQEIQNVPQPAPEGDKL